MLNHAAMRTLKINLQLRILCHVNNKLCINWLDAWSPLNKKCNATCKLCSFVRNLINVTLLANSKLTSSCWLLYLLTYSGNRALHSLCLVQIQLSSWIITDMPTIARACDYGHYQLWEMPMAYDLFTRWCILLARCA